MIRELATSLLGDSDTVEAVSIPDLDRHVVYVHDAVCISSLCNWETREKHFTNKAGLKLFFTGVGTRGRATK